MDIYHVKWYFVLGESQMSFRKFIGSQLVQGVTRGPQGPQVPQGPFRKTAPKGI